MVYIPSSHSLAIIDTNRKLSYLSLDHMEITHSIEAAYDGQLTTICYNEHRDEVAVGDDCGEIKVFGNNDARMLHLDSHSHGCAVTSLGYGPDGTKLVSGDSNGKILLWQVCNS